MGGLFICLSKHSIRERGSLCELLSNGCEKTPFWCENWLPAGAEIQEKNWKYSSDDSTGNLSFTRFLFSQKHPCLCIFTLFFFY